MALTRASLQARFGSLIRLGGAASWPGARRKGASGGGRAKWRGGGGGGGARRWTKDWRKTVGRKLLVCAALPGLGTAGIEARLVYLQVVDHAELMTRA